MGKALRKWAENCLVVVINGLPNLAITFGSIVVLSHYFPQLASWEDYLIGQVFSVQWSAGWARFVKQNWKIGGLHYSFSLKEEKKS